MSSWTQTQRNLDQSHRKRNACSRGSQMTFTKSGDLEVAVLAKTSQWIVPEEWSIMGEGEAQEHQDSRHVHELVILEVHPPATKFHLKPHASKINPPSPALPKFLSWAKQRCPCSSIFRKCSGPYFLYHIFDGEMLNLFLCCQGYTTGTHYHSTTSLHKCSSKIAVRIITIKK